MLPRLGDDQSLPPHYQTAQMRQTRQQDRAQDPSAKRQMESPIIRETTKQQLRAEHAQLNSIKPKKPLKPNCGTSSLASVTFIRESSTPYSRNCLRIDAPNWQSWSRLTKHKLAGL
jgi:hypothetical protein